MNLLSKLHKNSILTGPIESFCLACGCLLRSEEESYAHIHLPHHVDKLKALPQLDGYKDDCILKIKEGYFCPYCNIILPTIKRISLHVVETKHKDNKIAQSITRHADTIFLFDIVVIDPRSWQGVDGTTCSVCNEDYGDEEEHTKELGHLLKLIQAKCEFGDNYLYRNVDEDLFFCLICKKILPITDQDSHSDSKIHKENYEKASTEGAFIKSKISPELNNNKAVVNNDKTLPEVKQDSNTKVNSIKDSKDIDSNNLRKPVTEVDNGSPCVVDDNRGTIKTDTQGCNPNKANINTEKSQTPQVPKTEPTNKTQETAKSSTQIENTLKQETPKITPPKLTQEENKDSISNKDTTKVNQKVNNQNNDTKKNKQDLSKEEVSKDSNEKAQEITENNKVPTKELKDAVTPSPKVTKTNITELIKPGPVKSDTNGTEKDPGSTEPYLYKFLKSLNFVVRTIGGEAFCTLCEISVEVAEIGIHCVDKHHSVLYKKHIARKNKLSKKSEQETTNIKKETNDKDKKSEQETTNIKKETNDKDKTVTVTEKTKAQKTASNIDKPIEISTNNVDKDPDEDKVLDDSTDKNNQVVQKENAVPETPENKVTNEQISLFQPTSEKKNASSLEKSIKKAQKKAAKAKASNNNSTHPLSGKVLDKDDTVTNTSGDTRDPALGKTCDERVKETPIETNKTPDLNEKTKETIKTTVTKNKKVPETTENTRKNDLEKQNGTTNGIMPDAKIKMEKLLTFIKTMAQVNSTPEDVVINSKFVVGNLSFVLIVRKGDIVQCVACNQLLTVDIHEHIANEEHRTNFEDCAVVTSLDDEFIRQVKSKDHCRYHCGFCNMSLQSWKAMSAHLESFRHSDAKVSASWRLERYLPHMKHSEKEEVRSVITAVFRRTMD